MGREVTLDVFVGLVMVKPEAGQTDAVSLLTRWSLRMRRGQILMI